jgi:gamma-glutamylcysteine synthetase
MGEFKVQKIKNIAQRNNFYAHLLKDMEAFETMLKNNNFDTERKIGAEQEMVIIDKEGNPAGQGNALLNRLADEHYTSELAKYNLELNLDPLPLKSQCFNQLIKKLEFYLTKTHEIAQQLNTRIFLTGILPTITKSHLALENMAEEERYKILSDEFLALRGSNFRVYLQGIHDLNFSLDSILVEACNTSYQMHLQLEPSNFNRDYNWAQMIAAPVLSLGCNSPLLFGKELWQESRIALFKQSMDTRNFNSHFREKIPRVYFGEKWIDQGPAELWKNDIARFPLVLCAETSECSVKLLNEGVIPDLKSLKLHTGTTYSWNRLCYGTKDNLPHIRLECRYLPAGPTPIDQVANQVFWTGLMLNPTIGDLKNDLFSSYAENFYKVARNGMQSLLHWKNRTISCKDLIVKELLPISKEGLLKFNLSKEEIDPYLSIIESRAHSQQNGAQWKLHNFRNLRKSYNPFLSSRKLVEEYYLRQMSGKPVHEWDFISIKNNKKKDPKTELPSLIASDIMSSELFIIDIGLSVALALSIMKWRRIHHIIGHDPMALSYHIFTNKGLEKQNNGHKALLQCASGKHFEINPKTKFEEIKNKFMETAASSALVIEEDLLVGIITLSDLNKIENAG